MAGQGYEFESGTRIYQTPGRGAGQLCGRRYQRDEGNAAYPAPPVPLTDLQAAVDDFTAKVARAKMGGVVDTAAKNNSREALVVMLRQLAGYVQLNCNNDLATLLSSGFQAMSTNRSAAPLEQPQGLVLRNGNSGQLIARVSRVRNTRLYEGRLKVSDGDWLPSVFAGDSQTITFDGLTRARSTLSRCAPSAVQPANPIERSDFAPGDVSQV